jgi:hypothetical protein
MVSSRTTRWSRPGMPSSAPRWHCLWAWGGSNRPRVDDLGERGGASDLVAFSVAVIQKGLYGVAGSSLRPELALGQPVPRRGTLALGAVPLAAGPRRGPLLTVNQYNVGACEADRVAPAVVRNVARRLLAFALPQRRLWEAHGRAEPRLQMLGSAAMTSDAWAFALNSRS